MANRLNWIDQARGLSIFLVVYGHNFPEFEPYIYSFHVPLFFFIAGMFHPKKFDLGILKRRAKMILIPYFFWAGALFLFWVFFGRKYGNSAVADLSVMDNFIGIFYAQGGQQYMDWGIPMWFLPCIFLVFVFYAFVNKIKTPVLKYLFFGSLVLAGFLWPELTGITLPWSIDVALVAMGFYGFGHILKPKLVEINKKNSLVLLMLMIGINLAAFYFNPEKVDMYRSVYGSEALFFVSGLAGTIAVILLFKLIPVFRFLQYIGKHTIVLLATHARMLTLIKLAFFVAVGTTVFEFNELEKLLLSVAQIVLAIPIIWLVNKYTPILDGKVKKA